MRTIPSSLLFAGSFLAFVLAASTFSIQDNRTQIDESIFEAAECACENGKCVTDNRGITKCICNPRFVLQTEGVCKECYCGSKGKCYFHHQSHKYLKRCLCDRGYAEKEGTCIDCQCGENSKCEFEGDNKICYCLEGYAALKGVCTTCDCGDFGECEFRNEKKHCVCYENYLELNGKCEECDCGNGHCSFEGDRKVCKCYKGFSLRDDRCEACDCGEKSQGCSFGSEGNKICACPAGFSQKLGECTACSCGTHSSSCLFDSRGVKVCTCKEGFAQKSENCEICNCGNKSVSCSFGEDGNQICGCKPGFGQKGNLCIETCTEDDHCKNDGKCVNEGNKGHKFCKCKNGLTGDKCDIIVDCVNGLDEVCRNGGGICKYNPQTEKAYCECREGYLFNTATKMCQVCNCGDKSVSCSFGEDGNQICGCKPGFGQKGSLCVATCTEDDHCKHDGRCVNEGNRGDKFCKCKNGLTGDKCDIIVDCVNGLDEVCKKGGGICKYNLQTEEAYCECRKGYLFNTATKMCQECDCGNGDCSFTGDRKVCYCYAGFLLIGDRCEACDCGDYSQDCTIDSEGNKMCYCYPGFSQRLGKCAECSCGSRTRSCLFDSVGKKVCTCKKGFSQKGEICQTCNCGKNSVSCSFGEDGNQVCKCKPGFGQKGNVCIATCTEDYECNHDGKCINEGNRGDKFCNCKKGLSGDKCEIIDDCVNGLDYVCRNGAAACKYNPQTEKAYCECPEGYVFNPRTKMCKVCSCGKNTTSCQFLEDGSRLCQCKPGLGQKGNRCAPTCTSDDQCKYEGKCVSKGNQGHKFCQCNEGSSGDFCEIVVDCDKGLDKVCSNGGGYCKNDWVTGLSYCVCERGSQFNYVAKECQVCDCGENAISCMFSDDNGNQMCQCQPGYRQRGITCAE